MKPKLDFPCYRDWDDMRPTAQGRFCGACQKEVIDFTQKTDAEILRILKGAKEMSCGKFTPEQLQPVSHDVMRKWAVAALTALGVVVLNPAEAEAQYKNEYGQTITLDGKQEDAREQTYWLAVWVGNSYTRKAVISQALVVRAGDSIIAGGITDSTGWAYIKITGPLPQGELSVSTDERKYGREEEARAFRFNSKNRKKIILKLKRVRNRGNWHVFGAVDF